MPVGMDEQCRVYNEDLLGEIMTGEGKRLEDTGVPLSEEDLTYTMQLQAAQTRGPRSPARTPASRGTNMSRGTNKLSALKEATGSQHRSTLKTTLGKTSTVGSRTMSRQEEQHQMLNRRRIEQHEAKQREVVEESKLRVEAMHQKREKRFNFLYDTVFQGMMDPSGILTEMDAKLATHERAKEKRKEHLYQEWKEGVYDHMQHNLQSQLSQRSIEDIEARHNRNLEAYLRTQQFKGNQHYRGGVFRDVIIESDYDPLVANQSAIKIDVTGMKDPLKKDLERVRREKEELGYEVVNHGPVPGKTLFPVTMYHQPEATPYGHFSEPDGSLKEPLQQYKDTSAKKNASKVNMDQYSVARGKEVMLKEQLLGRGVVPPIGHRVGRRDFAEVVSHTHHLAPKHARADDQWLNAKGKMPVAAPCDPNRAGGLYDVINDLSDHRAPGGHGDLWMSQKGKLGGINPNPPPGTRRDLFEVVHQSEGRIFPGFTSGDRWIEAKGKKPFQNSSNYERRPPGEANIDYCLQDNDGIPLMP